MWYCKFIFALLVLGTWSTIQGREVGPRARLCYIADWTPKVTNLDPELCTLIIYCFGHLNEDGTLREFPTDPTKITLPEIAALGLGSKTRVGLSIGGWAEASERFTPMASTAEGRKRFIDSVLAVVRQHGLTAVEIAWISPTLPGRGGMLVDRANYVSLLREMKPALDSLNASLGVAIPVADGQVDKAYDLEGLARHADWMMLQAYDLHGHWEQFTGINAPINAPPGDNKTVTYWVNHILSKAPPERVILGMPAFGRTWTLAHSPVPGGKGSLSDVRAVYSDAGMMAYYEICPDLNEKRPRPWIMSWDELSKAPYAVRTAGTNRGYVSYDDASSIRAKVRLALQYGLAGVSLFTIDNDDFSGACSDGKYPYPLLSAAKEEMESDD